MTRDELIVWAQSAVKDPYARDKWVGREISKYDVAEAVLKNVGVAQSD